VAFLPQKTQTQTAQRALVNSPAIRSAEAGEAPQSILSIGCLDQGSRDDQRGKQIVLSIEVSTVRTLPSKTKPLDVLETATDPCRSRQAEIALPVARSKPKKYASALFSMQSEEGSPTQEQPALEELATVFGEAPHGAVLTDLGTHGTRLLVTT